MLTTFKYQVKTKFSKKKLKKKHSVQQLTERTVWNRFGLNANYVKRSPILKYRHLTRIEKRLNFLKILLKKEKKNITQKNIEKQISARTLRGIRHKFKLPVRGQRNKTNAKTQRKISYTYQIKRK